MYKKKKPEWDERGSRKQLGNKDKSEAMLGILYFFN